MKQRLKSKKVKKNSAQADENFYIAGVGASAGGLDAFLQFIENLPEQANAAFIFILHLDPKHKSVLPELLRHKAKMPVILVENKMPVKINYIYVIPENKKLTIVDHTLILNPRKIESAPHAVDYFFQSLAKHHTTKSIGIVLSGTGSDGTDGCRYIKENGGVTFAQDNTAKYDGMPSSAIQSGFIDHILPPAAIAKAIVSIAQNGIHAEPDKQKDTENRNEVEKIMSLIAPLCGVDFTNYKQATIQRRILRRMEHHKIDDLPEYVSFLEDNDEELQFLFKGMLINVTTFFREPEVFRILSEKLLPAILKDKKEDDTLRIWVAGCATGEEAYSIAICLLEYLHDNHIQTDPQIFVTDVSETMIEKARRGIYTKKNVANVSEKRLARFFTQTNDTYSINKQIRNICIFSRHNVLKDPPFSRLDIISCQNLLIYFEPVLQKNALQSFHYGLAYSGYLILGGAESVSAAPELFEKLPYKNKIFRKKNVPSRLNIDDPFHPFTENTVQKSKNKQTQENIITEEIDKKIDKLLLKKYVAASVLINSDLEIIHFRGPVTAFLQPSSGKASLSILKMLHDELVLAVRSILKEAKSTNQPVKKEGVQIKQDGLLRELTIEVFPFPSETAQTFYLILFQDTKQIYENAELKKDAKDRRINLLEGEINESLEQIDSLTQQFQTITQELQSANEESLSSNEELQTINEELQTSKEELQSTNEELTTINEELKAINAELRDTRDFSDAVVWTLHEPIIVLDADLRVLNANSSFYNSFNTTPKETEGVTFYKLGNNQWNTPELRKLLTEILVKKKNVENFEVTHEFPSLGKRTMLINARKLVQKAGKEELILLAIEDITKKIEIENKLKESEHRFRMLLQNGFDIITIFSADGTIQYQSPSVEQILGYKPQDRIGENIYNEDIIHPDDRVFKINMIQRCIANPKEMSKAEFRMKHANGSWIHVEAICQNLLKDPTINGLVANYRNITERKMLENQKDEFIGIASHELKTPVTSIKAYAQILEEQFAETGDLKAQKMINKMVTQVDKLTELIVDLLDVTKITGGQLQLHKKYFDLNELMAGVVEEIQRTTEKHTLIKQFDKTKKIFADRERIGQVLTNLLSNAVKYSPDSNKIIITSKTKEKNIRVCVQDYGIGIPKEMHHKIFERFFRMEDFPGKTYPGIGLGLYIASEIIHKSGGEIFVSSEKNKGSVFCFTLPVK